MKLTKKDFYVIAKDIVDNQLTDELFADNYENVDREALSKFFSHELDLLSKKSSSSKPTAKQKENETIKEKMVEIMSEIGEKVTISQLLKDERLSEYSNQKISALMTQLKRENKVVNVKEKKVSYFTLV